MKIFENVILAMTMKARIEGPLRLDEGLFRLFLSLPEDPLPEFRGPAPRLRGRGKDHPRYGRWMHAFVKFYKPEVVVEVGTNAGGTSVGIARALAENGSGRLVCVDNGEGRPRAFPDTARENIIRAGLSPERLELICDDSRNAIPLISGALQKKVGVYLVDAAHTFEAAVADMENGLPMMKDGGFVLVHDMDTRLDLGNEVSEKHPYPVYEAFSYFLKRYDFDWCVLKFIRKHLGVIRIAG